MSITYDELPDDSFIGDKEKLKEYLDFLDQSNSHLKFPQVTDRLCSPADLKKIVQTPQLTPNLREKILQGIRSHQTPERAAQRAGVTTKLWKVWLNQAEMEVEPWFSFITQCMMVEAEAEADALAKIGDSEKGAMFLLERRYSRPSLGENYNADAPKWRKPITQELLTEMKEDSTDQWILSKPKDRAKFLSEVAEKFIELDEFEKEQEKEE